MFAKSTIFNVLFSKKLRLNKTSFFYKDFGVKLTIWGGLKVALQISVFKEMISKLLTERFPVIPIYFLILLFLFFKQQNIISRS
jgi:hypothetical protein